MPVQNWNTNEAFNNTLEGEDVAEGCIPAGFNNLFRKMAAELRVFYNKSYRKNETVFIQATGLAAPAMTEGDILIEYTP